MFRGYELHGSQAQSLSALKLGLFSRATARGEDPAARETFERAPRGLEGVR